MSLSRIVPAHSRKPDPDEPWRYVCPLCGGQVSHQRNKNKKAYRCNRCDRMHYRKDLFDKKTSSEVPPDV